MIAGYEGLRTDSLAIRLIVNCAPPVGWFVAVIAMQALSWWNVGALLDLCKASGGLVGAASEVLDYGAGPG